MSQKTLDITLNNHTFRVPVAPEDEERLIEAATLVDRKLQEAPGRTGELRALTVALNLAYDLLLVKERSRATTRQVDKTLEQVMQQLSMSLDVPDTPESRSDSA